MNDFDFIVIGSGPAGSSVAEKLAKEGKNVAIVDKLFGGTCALKGCTPKKAMESITSTYWEVKDFVGNGFQNAPAPIDWNDLMAHKAKFTATVPAQTKGDFEEAGIKVIEGEASFLNSEILLIDGKEHRADKYILATGAKPRKPDLEGADLMITSDDFFELDQLPEKVVIAGGGYIGFELSHIIAACGVEVTILSQDEMPMPTFEEALTRKLIQATLHKGIEVKLGYEVKSVKSSKEGYNVIAARSGNEEVYEITAPLVINAMGRVPNVESLNIDASNLQLNEGGGIKVDKFLQAEGNERVYALGDVIGEMPFTEAANYEAQLLLKNFNAERRTPVDYTGMPMVVYTYPKMAMVGLRTEDCKNMNIKEASLRTSFIQRARANNFAGYKTIVDEDSKKILGAHMIGYNADEAINIFALAIQMGIDANQLNDSFLAYPTAIHDTKFLV